MKKEIQISSLAELDKEQLVKIADHLLYDLTQALNGELILHKLFEDELSKTMTEEQRDSINAVHVATIRYLLFTAILPLKDIAPNAVLNEMDRKLIAPLDTLIGIYKPIMEGIERSAAFKDAGKMANSAVRKFFE